MFEVKQHAIEIAASGRERLKRGRAVSHHHSCGGAFGP
jgi:hypothetical protein